MPIGIDDDLAFAGIKVQAAPATGDWHSYFESAAQELQTKFNFPVEYSRRQMGQESGGNRKAKSFAGASGLLQLMPATAKRYGVKDVNDPIQNINGWKAYMSDLLTMFNGDSKKALAAYNAGEGAVQKHGYEKVRKFSNFPKGDPRRGGYAGSTGAYVDKITGLEDINELTKQLQNVNRLQPKSASTLPSGNEDLEFALRDVPTAIQKRTSRAAYGAASERARRMVGPLQGVTGSASAASGLSPSSPSGGEGELIPAIANAFRTGDLSGGAETFSSLFNLIGGNDRITAEGLAGAASGTISQVATLAEIMPHDPFSPWLTPQNNPIRRPQHLIEHEIAASQATHAPTGGVDAFRQSVGRAGAALPIELAKLIAGGEVLGPTNLIVQGALSGGEQGPKGIAIGATTGAVFHFGGQLTAPLGKLGSFLVWTAGPTALGVGQERLGNAIEGKPNRPLGQQIGEHFGANLPFGAFAAAGAQKVWILDEATGKPRPAKVTDLAKIQRNPDMVIPPQHLADLVQATRNTGNGPEVEMPSDMLGRESKNRRAAHLEQAEALRQRREQKITEKYATQEVKPISGTRATGETEPFKTEAEARSYLNSIDKVEFGKYVKAYNALAPNEPEGQAWVDFVNQYVGRQSAPQVAAVGPKDYASPQELKNPYVRHEANDDPFAFKAPDSAINYIKEQAPPDRIPEDFTAKYLGLYSPRKVAHLMISDVPHTETYVAYALDPTIPNNPGMKFFDPEFNLTRNDLEGMAKAPETQKLATKLGDIFKRIVGDLTAGETHRDVGIEFQDNLAMSREEMQQRQLAAATRQRFGDRDFGGLSFGARSYFALNFDPANFRDGRGRIVLDVHNYVGAIHGLHILGEIAGENYSKALSRVLVQTLYHELLHNVVETNGIGDVRSEAEQQSTEGHGPEFDQAYTELLAKHAPRVIEYANELQQLLEENNEQITNALGQQALNFGLIERYERSARGGVSELAGKRQRLATSAVLSGIGEPVRTGWRKALSKLSLNDRSNAPESSYPLYQRYDFSDPDQRARFARKLDNFMGEKSVFKKEDGTYQELYHGTAKDFDEFKQGDIGIHAGPAEAANYRNAIKGHVYVQGEGYTRMALGEKEALEGKVSKDTGWVVDRETGKRRPAKQSVEAVAGTSILPVFMKLENPARIADVDSHDPKAMLAEFQAKGILTEAESADILKAAKASGKIGKKLTEEKFEQMRQALEAKGYDGLVYENIYEGGEGFDSKGTDSYVALRPEQVKSAIGNSGEFMSDSPNILRSSDPISLAVKSVIEGGKALYEAGKSFVEWSKGMVDRFGPGIKAHLTNIWEQVHRSLKGFNEDQRGAISPSLLTLGADKFVREDIAPAVKSATVGLMQSADTLQKIFAPASRGADAKTMAGILRESGARLWLKYAQAERAINDYRDVMLKLPEATQWKLMADTERGQPVAIPELQPAFDLMRRMNDENLALIQRHGKLNTFVDNYMGHMFDDPAKASTILQQLHAKKPLAGKKGMLKHRSFGPTIEDALAAGLKPAKGAENPIDMFLLKFHESRKFIMAMDAMKELKGIGLAKFVRPQDMQGAYNKGFREINDSVATVYGGGAAKPQGGTLVRGKYMAPEAAAQVINNYLSPGLGGNAIFRGFRTMANTLNQLQLGWSAFHAGFTTIDAAVSKFALGEQQLVSGIRNLDLGMAVKGVGSIATSLVLPYAAGSNVLRGRRVQQEALNPGSHPMYRDLVDALTAGGARFKQEHVYTTDAIQNMKKAFASGNIWGGMLRTFPASVEYSSAWIMKYLVPWQKLGVAADLARFELDRNPNGLGRHEMRAVMGKVVDTVDNRLGQMTYDNLFWNKVAKDVSMVSIRSVGWNVGTFREVGGGVYDFAKQPVKMAAGGKPEFTSRMAYVVALPMYLAMMGAITQYLYTGQGPQELKDYFAPRTGRLDERGNPERIMYPTYLKTAYGLRDAYKFGRVTRKTLINKANPGISIVGDMLSNEDFYGTEIANQDDPVVQQVLDYAKFAGKTALPFSLQNYLKEKERGASGFGSILPALTGITPAPSDVNQTPAEEELYWYNQEHRPTGTRNKYEAQRSTMMVNIRRALLKGDSTKATTLTQQALNDKTITPKDMGTILEQLQKTPTQARFADVSDPADAIRIWKLMRPSEKAEVQQLMMKKLAKIAELPENRQQTLYPQMTEVMKFYAGRTP